MLDDGLGWFLDTLAHFHAVKLTRRAEMLKEMCELVFPILNRYGICP